ncbi:hypothetical protein [Colwellia sp. KU-HH00111]|uniref:hypothetical protein n=1 Tax=Colwellia sp. KU-HH00111 TaxID=3127652 RepID=UPI00336573BA
MKTIQSDYAVIAHVKEFDSEKNKEVAFMFSSYVPKPLAYKKVVEVYEAEEFELLELKIVSAPYEAWVVILEDDE